MTASITKNNTFRKALKIIAVAFFWVCVWFGIAFAVGKEIYFPSPVSVIKRLFELLPTAAFWKSTAMSLARIFLGIIFSAIIGVVIAALTSRFKWLYDILFPAITVIKSTPVASFVILALIWIGKDSLPIFISMLIVFPVIWGNMSEGIKNIDFKLFEVAKVFRFGKLKKLKRLYIPSLMPYFISGLKTSIGLAWKAGISAEILCLPSFSIGRSIYESKLYLETTDLFAWTLVVVLFSILLEVVLMSALKKLGKSYNV